VVGLYPNLAEFQGLTSKAIDKPKVTTNGARPRSHISLYATAKF
jgi:hypothetical protein